MAIGGLPTAPRFTWECWLRPGASGLDGSRPALPDGQVTARGFSTLLLSLR